MYRPGYLMSKKPRLVRVKEEINKLTSTCRNVKMSKCRRVGKMSLLSCELFDILQKYYSAITCFYMFICFLFALRANIKSSDEGGRMISLKYKYMQFRLIQAKYF